MKIGIGLPNVIPGTGGRRLLGWAQRAEELGFDSLGVIDRVVYDSYEPLLALAMAAAVTERIELVTNVVIAPLRNTVMLAKQAASLDRASGGRLTLGLGLGGRDDDFLACGLPTRERGRRLDAQLDELRRIWQDTDIGPAPARPGGPRVLLGGGARHAGRPDTRWSTSRPSERSCSLPTTRCSLPTPSPSSGSRTWTHMACAGRCPRWSDGWRGGRAASQAGRLRRRRSLGPGFAPRPDTGSPCTAPCWA
jgi:hypothetical protein